LGFSGSINAESRVYPGTLVTTKSAMSSINIGLEICLAVLWSREIVT
jgi:hypothetical protein